MDVVLRTHLTNPALTWRDLERWEERYHDIPAGWRGTLALRSGPFAAELPFYFDDLVLGAFVRALDAMDRRLLGAATLSTPNEDPYVRLEVSPMGRVSVRGLLVDAANPWQRLEFEFDTDQTVLRPLADDFLAAWAALGRSGPADA
jgi:hypothetical protein